LRAGIPWHDVGMLRIATVVASLIYDGLRWLCLTLRSTSALEAENLFLRRQLALYVERGIKPRRIDSVTRIALTMLSRFFHWRDALIVVRPETLLRSASRGMEVVLAAEIAAGTPADSLAAASTDPADGP
jgi:putative transposase